MVHMTIDERWTWWRETLGSQHPSTLTFIGNLTFCMGICSASLAAATQFAILMATANFSKVIGDTMIASKLMSTQTSWFGLFAAQKLLAILPIACLANPKSGGRSATAGELV